MPEADPYRLERFVRAQDEGATLARALGELRAGRKRSHWMWFVFPQLAGLGHSAMSREFAVSSAAEARAYLAHPLLGPRLRECVAALPAGTSAVAVLGGIDAQKLHSCLTLFERADGGAEFATALHRFFDGPDAATLRLLGD